MGIPELPARPPLSGSLASELASDAALRTIADFKERHERKKGDGKMKVFMAWSGERSRALAQELRDWLPMVLHYVEPWMSETDIEAGQRWEQEVSAQLAKTSVGILCITPENMNSQWVLFEAGAISKSLAEARAIPLLLDLDFSDITGPLSQFQAKKADKDGMQDIIQSLNQAAKDSRIPEDRMEKLFEALWPQLEQSLAAIPAPTAGVPKMSRPQEDILEDVVNGMRNINQRLDALAHGSRGMPDSAGLTHDDWEMLKRFFVRFGAPEFDEVLEDLVDKYGPFAVGSFLRKLKWPTRASDVEITITDVEPAESPPPEKKDSDPDETIDSPPSSDGE